MSVMEKARVAVHFALSGQITPEECDEVARAVLMAVREPDPEIKSEITVVGWLEDELKYNDVWVGTIDAILNETS